MAENNQGDPASPGYVPDPLERTPLRPGWVAMVASESVPQEAVEGEAVEGESA